MNHNDLNVLFTMACDAHNKVDFLNISFVKDQDGGLTSRLFRKETADNGLLHASSFHPELLKKSIPYNQFLHIGRNCTVLRSIFKRKQTAF